MICSEMRALSGRRESLFQAQANGRTAKPLSLENLLMGTSKKIKALLRPSSAPDEARAGGSAKDVTILSRKFSAADSALSFIDASRTVIAFRLQDAGRRQVPELPKCDRTRESNVIPFRSREDVLRMQAGLRKRDNTRGPSIYDPISSNVEKYDYESESGDDYHQRMLQNILATVATVALMTAGYAILNTLAAIP